MAEKKKAGGRPKGTASHNLREPTDHRKDRWSDAQWAGMHASRVRRNKQEKIECVYEGCITKVRAENRKHGLCDLHWHKKFA